MKKVLSGLQIREIDAQTIRSRNISSDELMEQAAKAFTTIFCKRYETDNNVVIFCGPGNNGGDGLAIGRLLMKKKYNASVYYIHAADYSHDFRLNLDRLIKTGMHHVKVIKDIKDLPVLKKNTIIIDALFGTGLNKPITGFTATLIKWINNYDCERVSVDVPSGLSDSVAGEAIVQSDVVITFQIPKQSLMMPENGNYVEEFIIADIGLDEEAIAAQPSNTFFIECDDVRKKLKPVKRFDSKWANGHAMIISGSYDKTGAAILAASACMRCGVGLLTVHTPRSTKNIINTVLPEAITQPDVNDNIITSIDFNEQYSAYGIGPGIGTDEVTVKALIDFLGACKKPMVIDADALNIIARKKELIKKFSNHCITPHIKEFDRLTQEHKTHAERIETQRKFSQQNNCTVVLKSAYTTISDPSGNVYFNSTGNGGMAKAGSGDVLTGIITAFLAKGYGALDVAICSVFIHGLAGDEAAKKLGKVSMKAGDIIKYLPRVMKTMME